jgi:hypothetical protein
MSPAPSGSKNKPSKKPERSKYQAERLTLVSCLVYSSILKIYATCSSETSVDFQWTTQCHIPEDRTLHNHPCQNLLLRTAKRWSLKLRSTIRPFHSSFVPSFLPSFVPSFLRSFVRSFLPSFFPSFE